MKLAMINIVPALVFVCASCASQSSGITGLWQTDMFERESRVTMEGSGQWTWEYKDMSGKPFGGTWFVHDNILVLRVGHSDTDKILPGIAFTMDIREVRDNTLVLYDMQAEMLCEWKRMPILGKVIIR